MANDYQKINNATLKKLISQLKGSKEEQLDFLTNERAKRTDELRKEDPKTDIQNHPELDAYGMLYQSIANDHDPKVEYVFDKDEEPFTDKEYEDIYTAMYESGDPDYTDFYLKKYPNARGKDGFINYEHSSPELGKEYIKSHPELWEQTRKWLDTNKAIEDEPDELSAYTKDLEDYMKKNPKAKDKNYY